MYEPISILVVDDEPITLFASARLLRSAGYSVFEADAELRQSYVVLLSGVMTSSDNQSEGLEIGADGYLARPIANRELLARVQAMVRIIRAERERDHLNKKLQEALATIKTLSGMLPICDGCKKIRDDEGYWEEVELYVKKHSTAEFTHGICPACCKKLYGDINLEEE